MEKQLLADYKILLMQWSDRNAFSPDRISAGSGKKVWWYGFCGHEWQASVKNRVSGSGCPYCSGNRVLKGFNDFATKHPKQADEWSQRNTPLTPDAVTERSNKTVWWKCVNGHEWRARVADRSDGHGCPYCAGKILEGFNDLLTTNRSIMMEWSEKNTVDPRMLSAKSRQLVWWKCKDCQREWQARICTKIKGTQCPYCREKNSKARYELLLDNRSYQRSKKYRLPKMAFKFYLRKGGIEYLADDEELIGIPLQFYFPTLRIAVEFTEEKPDSENRKKYEGIKNMLCLRKMVKLIRVIAPDCTEYKNCHCIVRNDDSEETIEEALRLVFKVLKCTIDINISRDIDAIRNYMTK